MSAVNEIVRAFELPWGNYLIEGLIETQAPKAIEFWPSTIGWKVVAVIICFYLVHKTIALIQNYQANVYRRQALKTLNDLPYYKSGDAITPYQALPSILRATALQGFKRTDVCLLSGQEWETWLDAQCSDSNFSSLYSGLLATLSYENKHNFDALKMNGLLNEVRHWVKHHQSKHSRVKSSRAKYSRRGDV